MSALEYVVYPIPCGPGEVIRCEGMTLPDFQIQHVDRPDEILGVVSAMGNRASVRSKAHQRMLTEAQTLGAEALVGYSYDQAITVSTGNADGWVSALAVRFLPAGSPAPAPSKAVVALPPTVIAEDLGTGRKPDKTGAESVMIVTLGERHAFNAVLVVKASQAMAAAMYSKSAKAITRKSTATGEMLDVPNLITEGLGGQAIVGIGHAYVPSAKTVTSVHAGLAKAFETLPDLTQRAFSQ